MRFYRFLFLALAVGGVIALTGALRRPAGPRGEVEEPASPAFAGLANAPVEPTAVVPLAECLGYLAEAHAPWLSASLWMQARLPELTFQGEGSYVRAPGHRFRLELRTRLADGGDRSGGTVLAISDGRDLWTANRIGTEGWKGVTRLRLSAILDGPDSPALLPQVRSEFLAGPALHGLEPLVRELHANFDWVRREDMQEDVQLTGRWKSYLANNLAPANKPWPEALPRYCRLTLRGANRWPGRIEWWGPMRENGPDRLLVELEFRNPVLNRPLADEQSVGMFAFDPGAAAVEDLTPGIHAALADRTQQLLGIRP